MPQLSRKRTLTQGLIPARIRRTSNDRPTRFNGGRQREDASATTVKDRKVPGPRAHLSKPLYLLAAVLLLTAGGRSLAVTRYVNVASPCPGAGTQASPYCKIQTAICNAVAGDLVSVSPGTYNESLRMRAG